MNTGEYIIIKHAIWTRDRSSIIFIRDLDEDEHSISYYYPDEIGRPLRKRCITDFSHITIVPVSSLLLELL